MERLLEPFQFEFMRDAMITGSVVGLVCAVLSCYLVLKNWSLMGDAISHAVLPGIVVAYAVKLPLALGAFTSGLLCALATGFVKANSRVKEDTAMGVVFTGMFAFGLVLFSKIRTDLHLDHILFGNILGIERADLRDTIIVAGVTLLFVLLLRRDLLMYCFDIGHARAIGVRTTLLHYLLLALIAATVVAALKAVGIILVVAMLVTPGSIGFLWADRFTPMMIIASVVAVVSAALGIYISYFTEASTSACMVLVQSFFFTVALYFAPKRGVLARGKVTTG